jgi:Protein of unknown function (DUF4446)
VDDLTSTTGIVAMAAAGVALLSLLLAVFLAVRLRRLRAAQAAVLGANGKNDLVAHAARLEQEFGVLRDWMEEMAAGLDRRMVHAEHRIDGALAHRAVVRYDAYGELSGQQSASIALLDAGGSGVVVSSIQHRDQARVYVKPVRQGKGELELSPEEASAVQIALHDDASGADVAAS